MKRIRKRGVEHLCSFTPARFQGSVLARCGHRARAATALTALRAQRISISRVHATRRIYAKQTFKVAYAPLSVFFVYLLYLFLFHLLLFLLFSSSFLFFLFFLILLPFRVFFFASAILASIFTTSVSHFVVYVFSSRNSIPSRFPRRVLTHAAISR